MNIIIIIVIILLAEWRELYFEEYSRGR